MEFVIDEGDNSCHDQTWRLYSSLHMHPVCLGCIIETLERSDLLPLQKQPALSELLRLLCQQYEDILKLFLQEERIVWHILTIILMLGDDSYQATAIDTVLKLVERVGCEDLVNSILDNITYKVKSCYSVDRTNLLPYYTLLGKMLHQFPGLATTLLCNYEDLLNELSLELGAGGEGLQSAVAYMFIFVCGEERGLSPRIHQQLHTGIITMLTSAQALPVQINGLGNI
ncbi:meiosis inhibitor protein 1-like isoform X2 [Mya arenaria]|uniref:meiosis inhibitor protein 1-like isoform X2 n=1 Tax=Mya arenaria TaxID=6604 RepID=UPI0022E2AD87|nr:meiosis inhibitor protein 1-like isoform X2 [Mya arenaria]